MTALRDLQDRELAALTVAGESAAFGELARRYASPLRALLRRMGAQSALADDIAQDALLIAFERIATFRHDGPFPAWLNRIAVRLYVKRWRRDRALEFSFEFPDRTESFGGELVDLDSALQTLAAAERLCVSLCHGAGFSNSEIAQELKLPLGTVKSHIKRGLDKLRDRLAGNDHDRN